MLKLKTYEIPMSKSQRTLTIPQNFLETEGIAVLDGVLSLDIHRSDHMIHIKSIVISSLELQCDRSLDTFTYESQCNLEIIYKEGLKEEEIDLEAIRMEKVKRIEELEGLVEEAVGDDDFEKAELYQNEIDELKAEMM